MKFKDLKIRTKFVLVFSLIILVTISASVWQIKNIMQIGDNAASVYKVRLAQHEFSSSG